MLTIKDISNIIGGTLYDIENNIDREINDFETIYGFVKVKTYCLFFTEKDTWWRELGRSKTHLKAMI